MHFPRLSPYSPCGLEPRRRLIVMPLTLLLLVIGFVALYYGAEWMVDGASDIASHLKLSKSFVGLTLVAFGTSSPELFVNLIAAYHDHTELALSNIAGSNLTNLCLGFGISALLCLLPVRRADFAVDLLFLTLTPALVVVSMWLDAHQLSYGALIPFAIFLGVYLLSLMRRSSADEVDDPTHLTLHKPIIYFFLGIAALYVGGEIVYQMAVKLAALLQAPESLIGLTMVACGTSIPDVTASAVAARRGEFSICIGNILGSNISNIFIVLGGTLVVAGHSLQGDAMLLVDFAAITLLSLALAGGTLTAQRISRPVGALLLAVFAGYMSYRVVVSF